MTPSVSSLHYFSLLLNYRETSKLCVVHWLGYQPPILLRWHTKKHSAIVCELYLTHIHLGLACFTSFPGLSRSRILVYCLSILPENISTFEAQSCHDFREKRWTLISGQTDTRIRAHTHTHTHTHTILYLVVGVTIAWTLCPPLSLSLSLSPLKKLTRHHLAPPYGL